MGRIASRWQAGLCLLLVAGLAQQAQAAKIYDGILKGTGYVVTPGLGSGTGWVIDKEHKLMVTNEHVVGDKTTVMVFFPEYRNGKVIAEKEYYRENGTPVRGKVLDTDMPRDLAVIKLDRIPAGVEALKLAKESVSPADKVHSVGNPGVSDALWVYSSGTVRAVFHRRWRQNDVVRISRREAEVVQTQTPINGGDSGGPVVNDDGLVVAVVSNNKSYASLMSCCIHLNEVKKFVADVHRLMDPQNAADYNLRGRRLADRQQYDRAIDAFTQAIRLNPKFAAAYSNRAAAFADKRDFDTALVDCNDAIRIDPNFADAYNNRGNIYYRQSMYRQAVKSYTKAIQLDATDAIYHDNRGSAYCEMGEYAKAVVNHTQAIRIDSGDPYIFNNRGVAYFRQGRYVDAIKDFSVGIQLDPLDHVIITNRADSLVRKNAYDLAAKDISRALKIEPEYEVAWKVLGDMFKGKRDYDTAIGAYSRAIKYDAGYAAAYFNRGSAYEAKSSRVNTPMNLLLSATRDYRKAIQLDDSFRDSVKFVDRVTLRVSNISKQPMRVYLQYETKVKGGSWHWFHSKAPIYFTFAAGESATLIDDGWRVTIRRMRLWAASNDGKTVWQLYKNKDCWLVPNGGGYLLQGDPVYTYTFR